MEHNIVLAIILGISASLALNLGKGVQKMKVHILKKGKDIVHVDHRKDLMIWVTGVLMTVVAGPLFSLAFKFSEKPSIITSLGGVGLIGVLLFSRIVLKEIINRLQVVGAVLIIVGTIVVSYFDKKLGQHQSFNSENFVNVAIGVGVFVLIHFVISYKWEKLQGICLSIVAGVALGSGMILADVALVASGDSLIGQFKQPYVYAAILSGSVAFINTQFALMKADACVVIPIIHSLIIVVSLTLEYFLFGTSLATIQFAGVGLIILGVYLLTAIKSNKELGPA